MSSQEPTWVDVCEVTDIPWRGSRVLKTEAGCVALFRTTDDAVYAAEDRCPHKNGPISQGIVHGTSVTCPLHNMVFDLVSGDALGPDQGRINTLQARVESGRVLLDLGKLGREA